MLEDLLSKTKEAMEVSITFLQKEFSRIKVGRVSSSIIENLRVEYLGQLLSIKQLATITCPNVNTILIKPWEKKNIHAIEKAVANSKIDISPQNNGETISLIFPPITHERRLIIAKQAKELAENTKISIRNIRKQTKDNMKKLYQKISEDETKNTEEKLQKITDELIKKIDEMLKTKEKEITTL